MRHLNKWFPYEKPSKNKSSKHHVLIMGHRNVLRCVSGEQLREWSNKDVPGADGEIQRRLHKTKGN